jgi:putative spermidine/putrescine transport system permease protein
VFVFPVIKLLGLSLSDQAGQLSISHYEAFFASPAFVTILARTFETASVVTLIALLVGYPTAYIAATATDRISVLLISFVSGSLFISAIVRSYALLAILDRRGLLNTVLEQIGLGGLHQELVHNFAGVVIGCLQFAIPLMVLPIYAVMRRFDESVLQAAKSLGARPSVAFCLVYLPMTSSGVVAGCSIVFITTLGYYIVPSILGGPQNTMIGQLIAIEMQTTLDWGLGTAMASILLLAALICFVSFHRISRRYEVNVYG